MWFEVPLNVYRIQGSKVTTHGRVGLLLPHFPQFKLDYIDHSWGFQLRLTPYPNSFLKGLSSSMWKHRPCPWCILGPHLRLWQPSPQLVATPSLAAAAAALSHGAAAAAPSPAGVRTPSPPGCAHRLPVGQRPGRSPGCPQYLG